MIKLMIVDDSNIIRRRIQRTFNDSDITVIASVNNGVSAVEEYDKHKPDLITMDLTMPKMDGIECIRQIASIDEHVRILVISALSDKATGIKALSLGASGFLCKPFSDEELRDALNELINDLD